MNIWNINIIGDQSLDITNGDKHLYKERDWLSGEGVYVKNQNYKITNLLDLWEEIKSISPIEELHYSEYTITRYSDGFVFEHKSGYKDVVSDATVQAQDLLAFIDMLDEISIKEMEEGGTLSTHKKLTSMIDSLNSALDVKETTYDN